jgi:hypothetical protein
MKTLDDESDDAMIERRHPAEVSIGPERSGGLGSRPTATEPSAAGRRLERLAVSWGGALLIGIAIALAAIVSTRLAPHAAGPDRELEPDEPPGGGIVVSSELLHLWLPETLTDLAREQARSRVVRDHEALKRLLELRGRRDAWYGLTARQHQVNGRFAEITVIRRPYHDPQYYPELLAVLASLAGDPSGDSVSDFSTASIHIIPPEWRGRDPRDAIAELLKRPSLPRDGDAQGHFGRETPWSRRP